MKKFFLILSLLISFCSEAQKSTSKNPYEVAITNQSTLLGHALLDKDYETFVKYTYPRVYQITGGKNEMILIMKKGRADMEKQGTTFHSVDYINPSAVIKTGNELQCTLTEILRMQTAEGVVESKATLIAISADGGKNWTFMDTAGKTLAELRKSFTNLSPKLKFASNPKPVLYRNPQ